MKQLLIFGLIFISVSMVVAQPPHQCGDTNGLSVIYDRVDAAGYAPRLKSGSQAQFDCIAGRATSFYSMRFNSMYKAANYWFELYGAELGVYLEPLPEPQI